ncbi:MAG TPA: urease accessory protein UreD [Dongiaceae bacterium]|nr:urease accessory protein UreD [Dongiaceae bacterium]
MTRLVEGMRPGGVAAAEIGPPEEAGRIDVGFARSEDGRTYLDRQFASYPFHLCRPHTFAGDPPGMATLYLQSCSGGIYKGDRLCARIVAGDGTQAHVTTQAATIVHDGEGEEAIQETVLEARAGSLLEYLPDPLVLFPGASLSSRLRARVHDRAALVLGDSFIPHDPAGRGRMFDRLDAEIRVETEDGRPLARDRYDLRGSLLAAALPGINGAYMAQGTVFVVGRALPAEATAAALREALQGIGDIYAGASTLPNGCGAVARLLAADGVALRAGMEAAWAAARRSLVGSPPAPRRK